MDSSFSCLAHRLNLVGKNVSFSYGQCASGPLRPPFIETSWKVYYLLLASAGLCRVYYADNRPSTLGYWEQFLITIIKTALNTYQGITQFVVSVDFSHILQLSTLSFTRAQQQSPRMKNENDWRDSQIGGKEFCHRLRSKYQLGRNIDKGGSDSGK